MKPTITAFKNSPDRGRGLSRDMRVRWALEEVGQPYDVQLVTSAEMKQPDYRVLNPFGQIPTYREQDFKLFESGAIVLYIAENHPGLLPSEKKARTRAIMWMFCALNTVEPPIFELSLFSILERDKSWFNDRLPMLEDRVRTRLKELSDHLGRAEWLDGAFSVGDLLMATVLLRVRGKGLLEQHTNLCDYLARAEARPAYQRAFAAQLEVFNASLNGT